MFVCVFVLQRVEEEARQKEEGEKLRQERDKRSQKEEAERNERKKVIHTRTHTRTHGTHTHTYTHTPQCDSVVLLNDLCLLLPAPRGDHEENETFRSIREGGEPRYYGKTRRL